MESMRALMNDTFNRFNVSLRVFIMSNDLRVGSIVLSRIWVSTQTVHGVGGLDP